MNARLSMLQRLTVLQHNVLHWNTKKHELCNLYRLHDPHIILINSHGTPNTENIKIHTYTVHQSNKTGERHDGVAIAIKTTLRHKIHNNFTSELIAVEINTPQGPIIIATIYLPPRRPFIPEPDIFQLLTHRKPIYIMGDWNANHTLLGYNHTNPVGRHLARFIQDGTLHHIGPHFPTRITTQSATTPDIVLTNNRATLNIHLKQGHISTSDHLPTIATISTNPIMIPTQPRDNYKQANWEGYKQHLAHTTTPDLEGSPPEQINTEIDIWYRDLLAAKQANIPKTQHRTLPHHKQSHNTRQLKRQYEHIHQLAQLRGWDHELRHRFRHIQILLQDACKELHSQHWENLTRDLCNNHRHPKEFWGAFKRLMGSNKQHCTYIYNTQRQKIYKTEDIESIHRNFWSQNFQISDEENNTFNPHIEEQVTEALNTCQHLLTPTNTVNHNSLAEDNPLTARITPQEIVNIIQHTKNKAPGPSTINKILLQHLPPNMITRLCTLFNACLASGLFPTRFKTATLALIPKPGKSIHEVTSYRPISLLEVPGKILERIITQRLNMHLEDNNLHNIRQYGFRPNRGTDTAIALGYEEIALGLANKQQTNIILRDITKAFDKVWHNGLKHKLTQLNLPDNLTRILCNYLDGRTAHIKQDTYLGPPILLRSGVPQGSLISPTLFTFYTSQLPPPAPYSNYIAYADDITQIITHPSKSKHYMKLATERAISHITTFEHDWKIQTNIQKFTILPAARRNPPRITVNNREIPYKHTGKMLGLAMNTHGVSVHARQRSAQAHAALTKLKRFTCCNTATKLRLYKATVRPVLDYTAVSLLPLSHTQQHKLQIVQNRALRWATNTYYPNNTTLQQLHTRLNIEPLNIRRHKQANRTWNKLHNLQDPLYQNILHKHETTNPHTNHAWWPRTLPLVQGPEPPPLYTRTRQNHNDHDPPSDHPSDDSDDSR